MSVLVDLLSRRLGSGFPSDLRADVRAAARAMDSDMLYGLHFRENPSLVRVGDELLRVPRRHGFTPRTWQSHSSTNAAIEAAIAACNYDGFVRQRSVQPLIDSGDLWTMPYILELASDYVVEILAELDEHFDDVDRDSLREYVIANPAHLELVAARINSYWNVYYRTSSKKEAISTYPGFRILSAIAQL